MNTMSTYKNTKYFIIYIKLIKINNLGTKNIHMDDSRGCG
jgi:hypothetical protein